MIAKNVTDDGLEDVRLMTVTDLADSLRVSKRQIHRLRKSGAIPEPIRIGDCTRWLAVEISAWLRCGSPTRSKWETMRDVELAPTVEDATCE